MNRRGFLGRIAAAVGLIAVAPKVYQSFPTTSEWLHVYDPGVRYYKIRWVPADEAINATRQDVFDRAEYKWEIETQRSPGLEYEWVGTVTEAAE